MWIMWNFVKLLKTPPGCLWRSNVWKNNSCSYFVVYPMSCGLLSRQWKENQISFKKIYFLHIHSFESKRFWFCNRQNISIDPWLGKTRKFTFFSMNCKKALIGKSIRERREEGCGSKYDVPWKKYE